MSDQRSFTRKRRSLPLCDLNASVADNEDALSEDPDLDDSFVIMPNKDADERAKLQAMRRRQSAVHNTLIETRTEAPEKRSSFTQLCDSDKLAHYNLCMKLAQENKVNGKNAFRLHLIDYLYDLVKAQETPNFQTASMAIQAGTNIYAARVDSLHSETIKTASGLSIGKSKKSDTLEDDNVDKADEEEVNKRQIVKRRKGKSSIAKSSDFINYTKLETVVDAPDAMTGLISSAFKEGGMNGLMAQVPMMDDSCVLLLQDTAPYIRKKTPYNDVPCAIPDSILSLVKEIICNKEAEIFPSLNDFSFSKSRFAMIDSLLGEVTNQVDFDSSSPDVNRADIELPASPLGDVDFPCDGYPLTPNGNVEEASNNQPEMVVTLDEMMPSDEIIPTDANVSLNELAGRKPEENLSSRNSQYLPPTPCHIKQLSVEAVVQCFSSTPSDYCCFDPKMKLHLMGEDILRGKILNLGKDEKRSIQVAKKDKVLMIDFNNYPDHDEELEKKFLVGKRTVLTKRAIEKWNPDDCLAQPPSNYDMTKLMSFFTMPSFQFSQSAFSADLSVISQSRAARSMASDGGDGDNDCNGFDNFEEAFENHDSKQFEIPEKIDSISVVEAPDKVKKDLIHYAKFAKKIDVKEVKLTLWKVLRWCGDTKNNCLKEISSASCKDIPSEILGKVEFSTAYKHLLIELPQQKRDDISVSIAFVSLLHLANENNLILKAAEDMKSLHVSQHKQ